MKIIEKANLTMENALFGEKVFRANKTKVSNFDGEVVTDEWTLNKKYEVTPTKDFISKMNITVDVDIIEKGDILNIDMDGDGTTEKYLVLKNNGAIVELFATFTPTSGGNIPFNSGTGTIYAGGNLDTFLNETYYATLSATAKSAIVDKTFRQDSWYRSDSGNPDYKGIAQASTQYQVSLGSATYGSEITRHIYTLSVQDIIDYLEVTPEMTYENTTLIKANVQNMYSAITNNCWLISAVTGSESYCLYIDKGDGAIYDGAKGNSFNARPAFQIDLSKIEWSKDNA